MENANSQVIESNSNILTKQEEDNSSVSTKPEESSSNISTESTPIISSKQERTTSNSFKKREPKSYDRIWRIREKVFRGKKKPDPVSKVFKHNWIPYT